MNILYINTASEISIVEIYQDNVLLGNLSWASDRNLGADLLPKIDRLLNLHDIKIDDLSAILVNPGPGSFTGSRIGVVTATTLAWSLDVPVLASENPQKSMKELIPKNKYSKPVAVVYDRPASVTERH